MAISADSDVLTKRGFVKASDIKVGDVVYDMEGKETIINEIQEEDLSIRIIVRFGGIESIVVSQNQIMPVYVSPNKSIEYLPAIELFNLANAGYIAKIPSVKIQGEGQLDIDPWLMGFWLGDGCKRYAKLSTSIDDIDYIKKKILEGGYSVGAIRRDKKFNQKGISVSVTQGFQSQLRHYNLLMNKHVPATVFASDMGYRREVIRGLIDSDGMIEKNRGRAIFTNTDYNLALGCVRLASSLGELVCFYPNICHGFGKTVTCYNVTWTPIINPAGIPRKRERVRERKVIEKRTCLNIALEVSYNQRIGLDFRTSSGTMIFSNFCIPFCAGCIPEISRDTANKIFRAMNTASMYTKEKARIQDNINRISPVIYNIQDIIKDRRINDWNKKHIVIDGIEYRGYRDAANAVGCSEHTIQRALASKKGTIWGHIISS